MNELTISNTLEDSEPVQSDDAQENPSESLSLADFVGLFRDDLLSAAAAANPPVYDGTVDAERDAILAALKRPLLSRQRDAVEALARLLLDEGEPAAVLNGEMGVGKTCMAIATAAVMASRGYRRILVIAPPHLVYKWRREILCTVNNAEVFVLNGPDTLRQLLQIRARGKGFGRERLTFVILGRVRMRMGYRWSPCAIRAKRHARIHTERGNARSKAFVTTEELAACPDCRAIVTDEEGDSMRYSAFLSDTQRRLACETCGTQLWQLVRPKALPDADAVLRRALCQISTIGKKTADALIRTFGAAYLQSLVEDNLFDFVNLMDEQGDFVFSDRRARRIERALSTESIALGQGGYQPSEFIKRYLPDGFFDVLIADEGHEYKNKGSAQGQAMGVLAQKTRKCVLLTGTLMGGYASDLFYLLWRILTPRMLEDGFRYSPNGHLGGAAMQFMRQHGVLQDVYKESQNADHRTARGTRVTVRTKKAPGFGPQGIARYVLPYTVFVKLTEVGQALPPYQEELQQLTMTEAMAERYQYLSKTLTACLRQALAMGDTTLLGVVLNVLLAWPDCCFREEVVNHPRTRKLLAFVPRVLVEDEISPKEAALLKIVQANHAKGRKVLVYTVYTGKRDTQPRLKQLLENEGFKVAVLRSSVEPARREDWILDQVDRGTEVVITNPELVKTGLDLFDFPTLVFLQSGYNVYTIQQASRRSWRIGQDQPVDVFYLGYDQTAQIACLRLMARKIAVAQSTSGEIPSTGLDALNQEDDGLAMELAKRLLETAPAVTAAA